MERLNATKPLAPLCATQERSPMEGEEPRKVFKFLLLKFIFADGFKDLSARARIKAFLSEWNQNLFKCRFSETKGHFWKKALGTCHTCNELVAPEFLETHCFFDGKGRKKCSLFCPWNQDMILDGEILVQKNRFKTTCRCPRPNKRECSWKGQEKIDTLTCVETPTTTGASTTFSAFPFNPEGGN